MKPLHLILVISFLTLLGCSQNESETNEIQSKESNKITNTNGSLEPPDTIAFEMLLEEYKLDEAIAMKEKLISDLYDKRESESDLILEFFKSYDRSHTDVWDFYFKASSLISKSKSKMLRNRLNLIIEESGFTLIDSDYDGIVPGLNKDFLNEGLDTLVSDVSFKFINSYYDDRSHDHMGIDEVIYNCQLWGELYEIAENTAYLEYAATRIKRCVSMLISGFENSPVFDMYEPYLYRNDILDKLKSHIELRPESLASSEFKVLLALLEKEGFQQTNNVNKYITNNYSRDSEYDVNKTKIREIYLQIGHAIDVQDSLSILSYLEPIPNEESRETLERILLMEKLSDFFKWGIQKFGKEKFTQALDGTYSAELLNSAIDYNEVALNGKINLKESSGSIEYLHPIIGEKFYMSVKKNNGSWTTLHKLHDSELPVPAISFLADVTQNIPLKDPDMKTLKNDLQPH